MEIDRHHYLAVPSYSLYLVLNMSFKTFANKACKYYPCHHITYGDMNCLFCFCPLFHMENCGGNYTIGKCGKDCSACTLPHGSDGYDIVIAKLKNPK